MGFLLATGNILSIADKGADLEISYNPLCYFEMCSPKTPETTSGISVYKFCRNAIFLEGSAVSLTVDIMSGFSNLSWPHLR